MSLKMSVITDTGSNLLWMVSQ